MDLNRATSGLTELLKDRLLRDPFEALNLHTIHCQRCAWYDCMAHALTESSLPLLCSRHSSPLRKICLDRAVYYQKGAKTGHQRWLLGYTNPAKGGPLHVHPCPSSRYDHSSAKRDACLSLLPSSWVPRQSLEVMKEIAIWVAPCTSSFTWYPWQVCCELWCHWCR